jgi:hypothetical protein
MTTHRLSDKVRIKGVGQRVYLRCVTYIYKFYAANLALGMPPHRSNVQNSILWLYQNVRMYVSKYVVLLRRLWRFDITQNSETTVYPG